jgi:hypothetical protein
MTSLIKKHETITETVKSTAEKSPVNATCIGALLAYNVAMCRLLVHFFGREKEVTKTRAYIDISRSGWMNKDFSLDRAKSVIRLKAVFARAAVGLFAIAIVLSLYSFLCLFNIPHIKVFDDLSYIVYTTGYLSIFGTVLGAFDVIRFALIS